MRLRFTKTAARQLERVLLDIDQQSPPGARRVQERLRAVLDLLSRYPQAGQLTARKGIRRVVVVPFPYIITYRLGADVIVIRSIRHSARRPLS